MSDKEIILEQQDQISRLKDMLDEILDKPKHIAIVEAGPFIKNGTSFYTVNLGGSKAVIGLAEEPLFGDVSDIKPDDQVIVLGSAIVGIIPRELVKNNVVEVKLTSWDEIGGMKSQKETIKDMIELPLHHADLAKDFGITPSKGILLYGPPGCGKTLTAKAIASTVLETEKVDARAFTYVKGAEMLSMYVGSTEQQIGNMFKKARDYMKETGKQAVIFIDEADAILPARGSRKSSDVDRTIVPTFLSEMDGFDDYNPFILLSTNLPDSIDDAVLREGRIDVKVPITRPTKEDAEEIFEINLKNVKCSDEVPDLCKFAAHTLYDSNLRHRVSGAMIKTAVNLAAQTAMKRRIQFPANKTIGITEQDIVTSLTLINHGTN